MAFKPSQRSQSEDIQMDLDIRPVMNLMVVLIPLLISCAEWVKISVIEINVPPSKGPSSGGEDEDAQQDEMKEQEKRLGLKIAVVHEGITIGNAATLLEGEEGEGPTITRKEDGKYDYEKLREKLIEIKKLIAGKGFKDEDRAVLTASADIEYQVIIDIMDNIQTYENDKKEIVPLFPQVNFGSIL
ncbi:MAG: biopolymer transporter ExbD [Calditrichaceae bacterium]|nr:biopolymer transporter ExbD [Calditrichaceae bacterium]